MESEAWDELVAEYQAREAELQARAGMMGGEGQTGDSGDGSAAGRENTQPGAETGALELDALATAGSAGRAAPSGEASPSGQPPAGDQAQRGSSQSALEFLTAGAGSAASNAEPSATPTAEKSATSTGSAGESQPSATSAEAGQPGQPASPETASATAANAEAKTESSEESQETTEAQDIEFREQEGVIAIRDLDKARGVTPVVEDDDEEAQRDDEP
jgi:hypothetical protein